MKRHRSMLARSAATALVAVGLISSAAAQSTIDIGLVQPLTGAFAAAGTDVVNGAKIAADEMRSTRKAAYSVRSSSSSSKTPKAIRRKPLR